MELESGGGYIVARYNHSHGTREWGVDISWHDIISPMELDTGVDILWHYIHSHGTTHRVKKHPSNYEWYVCHILPWLAGGWKYRKGGEGIVTIFSPRVVNIVRYFKPGVRIWGGGGGGGGGGGEISYHTGRRTGWHNECCVRLQYQPRQRRPYKSNFYSTTITIFFKKARETCIFDVLYRCSTGQLVTSQLVCDVTINRPRTTSATANLGFHSQSSLAMQFASDDMPFNE